MQGYFYFWVILSFVWGLVAAAVATSMPIWESRFIVYSMLGSLLPCFPQLKAWGKQDPEGPAGAILTDEGLEADPKLTLGVDESAARGLSEAHPHDAHATDGTADKFVVK